MDADDMARYIGGLPGVRAAGNAGDTFFLYDPDGVLVTGYDYAALDTLMPHPVYASQHWVCVLNPGPAALPTVTTLLAGAHQFAARKHAHYQASRGGAG